MEKIDNKKGNVVINKIKNLWLKYEEKHPGTAQFIMFFVLSNGITFLQMVLMPTFKKIFGKTSLVNTSFQILQIGTNFDGSPYYVFDYVKGALSEGGGGGLAYFLAVQIVMAIAQIINFFVQRNVTFKSKSNIWKAAFWYVIAYFIISIGAAALQGIYKAPIYSFLMNSLPGVGETLADFATMIINSAISFWVFFPIFKIIFKDEK